MLKGERPDIDPVFELAELLYRRFDPEDVDQYEPGKYRVLTTGWTDLHNMSVVRSKYAQPDYARWDSAADPENQPDFVPQLYRDWYVAQLVIADVPAEIPSQGGGVQYQFVATHVPFDDLYGHSEIRSSKGGVRIAKQNKFKSEKVKVQYRGILSDKAVVVLVPEQIVVDGAL